MKSTLLLMLATFLVQNAQIAKNDPNGVWESDTGTKFEMKLSDSDLQVRLVKGSNPVYLSYDVDLKSTGEVNSYEGSGAFVAKLKDNECKFDTTWRIVIVQAELIAGVISHVVPDAASCEVIERRDELIQLKKVK